jgi:hypothetical protein
MDEWLDNLLVGNLVRQLVRLMEVLLECRMVLMVNRLVH